MESNPFAKRTLQRKNLKHLVLNNNSTDLENNLHLLSIHGVNSLDSSINSSPPKLKLPSHLKSNNHNQNHNQNHNHNHNHNHNQNNHSLQDNINKNSSINQTTFANINDNNNNNIQSLSIKNTLGLRRKFNRHLTLSNSNFDPNSNPNSNSNANSHSMSNNTEFDNNINNNGRAKEVISSSPSLCSSSASDSSCSQSISPSLSYFSTTSKLNSEKRQSQQLSLQNSQSQDYYTARDGFTLPNDDNTFNNNSDNTFNDNTFNSNTFNNNSDNTLNCNNNTLNNTNINPNSNNSSNANTLTSNHVNNTNNTNNTNTNTNTNNNNQTVGNNGITITNNSTINVRISNEELILNNDCQYQLEDLVQLGKIGQGNSGTVVKVLHVPTSTILSKKTIPIEKNNSVINKQLLSELSIMKSVKPHPNIVDSFGAMINHTISDEIVILMEYMDCGSLDKILTTYKNFQKRKQTGTSNTVTSNTNNSMSNTNNNSPNSSTSNTSNNTPNLHTSYVTKPLTSQNNHLSTISTNSSNSNPNSNSAPNTLDPNANISKTNKTTSSNRKKLTWFNNPLVISKISFAVLNGLSYLYENYKIIHRDIKPSNVLINSHGDVKICDFGVSKMLSDSIANTFVGTSTYMSPERIQGNVYSVKGDIWSLGLVIIELVTGEFPLGGHNDTPHGILDLLQKIVNEKSPSLPVNEYNFPSGMIDFVNKCCLKDTNIRPSINQLMKHEFILKYNNNLDDGNNVKEFKHWCKKIKYKIRTDKQIRREINERLKLERQLKK